MTQKKSKATIGDSYLFLDCGWRSQQILSLNLLQRLIRSESQQDVADLFGSEVIPQKALAEDKLPAVWKLDDLKDNGHELIKVGNLSVMLFFREYRKKWATYYGFYLYSIPFPDKEQLNNTKVKAMSLQNVAMVYSSVNGNGLHLNILAYFGEKPNDFVTSQEDLYHDCTEPYNKQWERYEAYLKEQLELNDGGCRIPKTSIPLANDTGAWINTNGNFISWEEFAY